MSWLWTGMIALSFFCSIAAGNGERLAAAVSDGAGNGVSAALRLAGPVCLWSALSEVMRGVGLTEALARLLNPILRVLFPDAHKDSRTREAICGNISANLLGLGNAATPQGIRAVRLMSDLNTGTASNEICRLIVMNTASIQLLPTTVAAVRASLGAASAFDILPAVWLSSACALLAGLTAAKILSRWL